MRDTRVVPGGLSSVLVGRLAVACRAVAEWSRVAQSFYLGCTAWQAIIELAASEILPIGLPRPLETSVGVPCGRSGNEKGGRAAQHGSCDFDLVDPPLLLALMAAARQVLRWL